MPFDGIFMSNMCRELSSAIGSRAEKIHQPTRDDIVILLGNRGFSKKLLISISGFGPRVQFTDYNFENPATPPMFCMLMRKHFTNARLESITQNGYDRVVSFNFSGFNELGDMVELSIIAEMLGRKSNLIMTCNGKIIDAVRRTDPQSEGRMILPGVKYELPEPQAKFNIAKTDNLEIINALGQNNGLGYCDVIDGVSPLVSREISFNANCSGISAAIDCFRGFVNNGKPITICKNGQPQDFTYMPINQYGEEANLIEYDSFSQMLDIFYANRQKDEDIRRRTQELRKAISVLIERTSRRIDKQKGELERCADMDKLRIFGELIKANLYAVTPGSTFVDLPNYYDPECALVRVPLKPDLTPSQNAQRYFKEYRKANTAKDMLVDLIAKGENELIYLGSVADELNRVQSRQELAEIKFELMEQCYIRLGGKEKQKAPKALPPLRFKSSDGFEICVGRNNRQNDQLTKSAAKNDIWLHTKAIHGSHTIIYTQGREVSDQAIMEAACLCAYHSDAKNSSSVPVDYCPVRNVKKPNGSAPGMVIYDNYNTVYVTPDENIVNALAFFIKM